MNLYRVTGGLFFILYFLSATAAYAVPNMLMGVIALIAGIALLAGY